MTTTTPTANTALDQLGQTTTMAVSYLRVSTKEQAQRGGRNEGFSIPAQRQVNLHKASSLGAVVVEEFIDAGESAKTADRPELQRMLNYVKTHQVAYCIVHKVDRLARNRADDVTIHLALKEAGVTLVSATENIDETPSGALVHGIMSSIAEFYSQNLATEVIKGLTQKAQTGGTPTKAPLGYRNTRSRDQTGRDIATVETDPERAPLITWMFEAYATGNYSITALREELTIRGLTTMPTPKRASKPPAKASIHRMLTNPYYKGDIVYKGVTYQGNHQPLVQPEIWYRVQTILQAHNQTGEKTQTHSHYLIGTIYCSNCDSRLLLVNARNKNGVIYPYFVCSGRHTKRTNCQRTAMPVHLIEDKIADHYKQTQIPQHTLTALRELLITRFDQIHEPLNVLWTTFVDIVYAVFLWFHQVCSTSFGVA